ncbi:NAC domain-containing protein 104-like [Prunus avium]|uniref:NAC domain-containing protein 104-like n=1 Tax=Prunus avium TaxID=42229 RepID=A0A6P5T8Q2_PRUAV|nr:NAC domain-containing protein 104-like [Prunus avium]
MTGGMANGKALGEGNKWYFYSRRTQNRVTSNGYWKALGVEEPVITRSSCNSTHKVWMKRYLAFYVGEAVAVLQPGQAPNSGIKTNWIMREYRLSPLSAGDGASSSSSTTTRSSSKRRGHLKTEFSGYVLCRVYERDEDDDDNDGTELSCLDEVFLSLDDLDEISLPN